MRPQRLPDFDYRGCHRYFVTCCTRQRQLRFTAAVVELVQPVLISSLRDREFNCLAWVFMPDHVHLVVEGLQPSSDLRSAMTVARQRTAVAFHRTTGSSLWQDGYYERVVRNAEETPALIAYILNNPVRAGLVSEWHRYPHSWAADLDHLPRRW